MSVKIGLNIVIASVLGFLAILCLVAHFSLKRNAALAWLSPLALLVVIPAGLKRRYDEFGLQLPWATRAVFAAHDFLYAYWWVVLPVLVGGTILVAGVGSYLVRHHVRPKAVHVLWWLLAFAPPALFAGVIVAGSILPEIKLREGLKK